MNIQQVLSRKQSKAEPTLSNVRSTRFRKIRLLVLRLLWGMVAVSNLIIFFVGFPLYYHQLLTICPSVSQGCNIGQLLPGNLVALQHLGISLETYATYTLTISIVCSSLFLVAGLLIFWRKSDEPMAILASIIFLTFAASADAH